jgi:polysaccharide biosynthesis protein PslG
MRTRTQILMTRGAVAALAVGTLAGCGGGAAEPASLKGTVAGLPTTSPIAGIQDDRVYQVAPKDAVSRVQTMARMGARIIRVDTRWDVVATRRPANPKDPNDPAYDWAAYDPIVDAAAERGVRVLMTVWGTPAWAADTAVPKSTRFADYTRRPKRAGDYGNFAYALAARYAPRGVRDWEIWNEPNIPMFLRPQFRKQRGTWVPASPATYSALAKSFYANVKMVDKGSRIAGLVTAPAGDQCPSSCPKGPNARMTPSAFLAAIAKPGLRPPMNTVSHHPYPITTPRNSNFPGSSYIDLYNIDRFQREVDRTYLRGKKIWLTEFGFSTEKVAEYSLNVSEAQQAQYLQDAYRRVRPNTRVKMFVWYFLQDNGMWGSGLLRLDGKAKPAAEVFSIPMSPLSPAPITRGAASTLVGQVRPTRKATQVLVERRNGDGWVAVAKVRTGRDGSFAARVRPGSTTTYRAVWTGDVPSGTRQVKSSWPVTVRVK